MGTYTISDKAWENKQQDLEKDNNEFWEDIIYKDGKMDEKQVMKELHDFKYVMEQVSVVYENITNGLLSKIMYAAGTVITVYEDDLTKKIEEARKEEREKIADDIEKCIWIKEAFEGMTLNSALKESYERFNELITKLRNNK